jgi:putative transposase
VPLIDVELRPELHAYLGGMILEVKGTAYLINGTADHVHLLVNLPPTIALSDAMKTVKANSSRWVAGKWSTRRDFHWQIGYGAFSVSKSNVSSVIRYIENQENHHRKTTLQEEF